MGTSQIRVVTWPRDTADFHIVNRWSETKSPRTVFTVPLGSSSVLLLTFVQGWEICALIISILEHVVQFIKKPREGKKKKKKVNFYDQVKDLSQDGWMRDYISLNKAEEAKYIY